MAKQMRRYDYVFDGSTFAADVRRERKRAHMSQRDIANMVEVDHTTISRIENYRGDMSEPPLSFAKLLRVVNILELDPRDYWVLENLS